MVCCFTAPSHNVNSVNFSSKVLCGAVVRQTFDGFFVSLDKLLNNSRESRIVILMCTDYGSWNSFDKLVRIKTIAKILGFIKASVYQRHIVSNIRRMICIYFCLMLITAKCIAGRQGMLCCDLVLIIYSLVNETLYYILAIEPFPLSRNIVPRFAIINVESK